MKTEIIFEDNDILVIYKPAGIATQTSKVGERDVVSELKNYLKGGFVGVIHRLDQPVEGVLVFAKNQKTAAALSALVKEKSVSGEALLNKEYLAVVYGEPSVKKARLENMMVKTPDRTAKIVEGGNDSKKAVLSYELLETIEIEKSGNAEQEGGCKISLLRVNLETGRFHQIRAQLANAGLPIIGDKKYGSPESIKCAEELKVRNVSLCADRLLFSYKNKAGDGTQMYSHQPQGILFSKFTSIK